MTPTPLRSGTALSLILALAMPAPVTAQTSGEVTAQDVIEEFGEALAQQCGPEVAGNEDEALRQAILDACVQEGILTEEQAAALAESPPAEASAAAPAEATLVPADEIAPEALAEPEAEVEAEPAEVEEIAPEVEAAAPEAELEAEEVEAAPEAELEAPVVEEAAPEAEVTDAAPETSPTPEPAPEAPVTGEAAAEETPAESAEEVAPEAPEVAPPGLEAPEEVVPLLEEAPTEEVQVEEAPAAEIAEPAEALASEAPAVEEADADEPAVAEDGAEAAPPVLEAPQEDTAESVAAADEAPAAAAAEDAGAEQAEAAGADDDSVTTEVVTEEEARSSDEGFEERAERRDDDDDDGLSNFQKALLLGIGAVAVGAAVRGGGQVVESTGDRVVVQRPDGDLQVLKNDDELLRRPGATVSTRTYDDGSTLTTIDREDGSQVVTIRAANGQVLRRTRVLPDGTEIQLFDDTRAAEPVDLAQVRRFAAEAPRSTSVADLRDALARDAGYRPDIGRTFTLQQIRQIRAVRDLMPQIDLSAINFATGSAAIPPSEAEELRDIGDAIAQIIDVSPDEVFLVEGHTDAVGSASSNLALSDRRAESVALALTEYFDVPPENLVVQGYGESDLAVQTPDANAQNRRVAVRRITPLLQSASVR